MDQYDNWKLQTPEDEEAQDCPECGGLATYRWGGYCSRSCRDFDD